MMSMMVDDGLGAIGRWARGKPYGVRKMRVKGKGIRCRNSKGKFVKCSKGRRRKKRR